MPEPGAVSQVNQLSQMGYCVLSREITAEQRARCEHLFNRLAASPGRRFSPSDPEIAGAIKGMDIERRASELASERMIVVRVILFEKSRANNWLVPWHQDVTLAMPCRLDVAGFQHWAEKDGIWHAQPPVDVLNSMLALRVHVDDCGIDDGALRVIPGSHLLGRLTDSEIENVACAGPQDTLAVKQGQVVAFKPLLVHSSRKATGVSRRRVLHVEFCASRLYHYASAGAPIGQ